MNIIQIIFDKHQELFTGFPFLLFGLFFLSMLVCTVGFFRLVYFISIGYGYSICLLAIVSLFLFRDSLTIYAFIQCMILIIYGFRLGTFLLLRERMDSFSKEKEIIHKSNSKFNFIKKISIWIPVSLLYVLMFYPALFHLHQSSLGILGNEYLIVAGLAFSLLGLILEAFSDSYKSKMKKIKPSQLVFSGVFRFVRYPNYLGEISIWFGSWLASLTFYNNWISWIMSTSGFIIILLIMLGSAKRLEEKQEKRYIQENYYNDYVSNTPILFPFIPLYSLKKLKVFLG